MGWLPNKEDGFVEFFHEHVNEGNISRRVPQGGQDSGAVTHIPVQEHGVSLFQYSLRFFAFCWSDTAAIDYPVSDESVFVTSQELVVVRDNQFDDCTSNSSGSTSSA
jgi:hypothetical protein